MRTTGSDPKDKEEALRKHWQEIFKIQPEDNIDFDEENEEMVNQHLGQHQEEFQEEETIEFNRLDWDNSLISPVTAEEVKARITSLKKK